MIAGKLRGADLHVVYKTWALPLPGCSRHRCTEPRACATASTEREPQSLPSWWAGRFYYGKCILSLEPSKNLFPKLRQLKVGFGETRKLQFPRPNGTGCFMISFPGKPARAAVSHGRFPTAPLSAHPRQGLTGGERRRPAPVAAMQLRAELLMLSLPSFPRICNVLANGEGY